MNRVAIGVSLGALALGAGTHAFAGPEAPRPASKANRADAVVELGRRLFFDPAVSKSETIRVRRVTIRSTGSRADARGKTTTSR